MSAPKKNVAKTKATLPVDVVPLAPPATPAPVGEVGAVPAVSEVSEVSSSPPADTQPDEAAKVQAEAAAKAAKEDYELGVQWAQEGEDLPAGASQALKDGYAAVDKATKLRLDGPTLEEYVKAGYAAENYPPKGYAKREVPGDGGTVAQVKVTDPTGHLTPSGAPMSYKPISFVHNKHVHKGLV